MFVKILGILSGLIVKERRLLHLENPDYFFRDHFIVYTSTDQRYKKSMLFGMAGKQLCTEIQNFFFRPIWQYLPDWVNRLANYS